MTEPARQPLRPKLCPSTCFGTLISVRDSSYGAFERILGAAGATASTSRRSGSTGSTKYQALCDRPYQSYRDICQRSLGRNFAHFGVGATAG